MIRSNRRSRVGLVGTEVARPASALAIDVPAQRDRDLRGLRGRSRRGRRAASFAAAAMSAAPGRPSRAPPPAGAPPRSHAWPDRPVWFSALLRHESAPVRADPLCRPCAVSGSGRSREEGPRLSVRGDPPAAVMATSACGVRRKTGVGRAGGVRSRHRHERVFVGRASRASRYGRPAPPADGRSRSWRRARTPRRPWRCGRRASAAANFSSTRLAPLADHRHPPGSCRRRGRPPISRSGPRCSRWRRQPPRQVRVVSLNSLMSGT